jgi:hypothetical protein
MTVDLTAKLDEALAMDDDEDFLEAIGDLDSRYDQVQLYQRPVPLSWLASLAHFHFWARDEGIGRYLSLDGHLDFALVLESARRFGAERTVSYLEAGAALYPRAAVPVDDRKRHAVIDRIEARERKTGAPSGVAAIDERFADALPALAGDLRRWIGAHRSELNEMLARVAGPAAPVPDEIEQMQEALVTIEQAVERVQDRKRRHLAALAAAAEAKGMLPWRDAGVHPQSAAFYAAAAELDEGGWTLVATRGLGAPRKFSSASRLARDTTVVIMQSTLVDSGAFEATGKAHRSLREPAVARTRALPVRVVVDGKPIGLLSAAHEALFAVSTCLRMHDWMILTPDGLKAARLLYSLFEGLAPCPALPGRVA